MTIKKEYFFQDKLLHVMYLYNTHRKYFTNHTNFIKLSYDINHTYKELLLNGNYFYCRV